MARQSYRTIARLRHRLQAERLWTPAAQEAAYSDIPPTLPPRARNKAIRRKEAALKLLDSLFPED